MNANQAAAFIIPLGPYRHCSLAVIATQHPDYVLALAEGAYPAECRPGTAFHQAVTLIAERIKDNLISHSIDAGIVADQSASGARWNEGARQKWLKGGGGKELAEVEKVVAAKEGQGAAKRAGVQPTASTSLPGLD